MYVKNSTFAIYLGLAALAGCGASFLFFSNVQGGLLSGDVSQSEGQESYKEDPEYVELEERLQNDAEFFTETKGTFNLISKRVDELQQLTSETIQTCSNIPEFKESIKSVVSLNAKTYNTQQSLRTVKGSLEQIASKKDAPEYGQASNDVYVGFHKIECQLAIGKAFVEVANSYLENTEAADREQIAVLVDKWTDYCMEDALLNNSEENIEYWKELGSSAMGCAPIMPRHNVASVNAYGLDQTVRLNLDGMSFCTIDGATKHNIGR